MTVLTPLGGVGTEVFCTAVALRIDGQTFIVVMHAVEVTGIVFIVTTGTGRRAGQTGIAVTETAEAVLGRGAGAANHRQGAGGQSLALKRRSHEVAEEVFLGRESAVQRRRFDAVELHQDTVSGISMPWTARQITSRIGRATK